MRQRIERAGILKSKIKDMPSKGGWYRYLANRESASQLGIDDELWEQLSLTIVNGQILGYVYVGLTTNIKQRFGHHLRGNIAASTLRRSIHSLLPNLDKDELSNFIDNLYAEYFVEECSVCRVVVEQSEMKTKILPLNVDENVNPVLTDFVLALKNKRKMLLKSAGT